jgi:hypothetical protein
MPIPFVQETFSGNLPINWYPEEDQQKKVVLRQRPGLNLVDMVYSGFGGITGPIRSMKVLESGVNQKALIIWAGPLGSNSCRIYVWYLGDFQTGISPMVSVITHISSFVPQACYIEGNSQYAHFLTNGQMWTRSWTYPFNTWLNTTIPFTPRSLTWQDGYFIASELYKNTFYVSYDGWTWDAADVASAESDMDQIVRVISNNRQLWLFGTDTLEIWYNSGDVFPFTRISGGVSNTGLAAEQSVEKIDSNLVWIDNRLQVRIATGIQSKVISSRKIDRLLQSFTKVDDAFALSYVVNGHWFYHLTFPTENKTLVYDHTTEMWHEQAYLYDDTDNTNLGLLGLGKHRINSYAFFDGKHIVGDYFNENLYYMAPDVFDDNGREIVRELDTLTFEDNGNLVNIPEIRVEFAETGDVPATGQGSDPQCMLKISRNGGKTWGNEKWAAMGKIGEYDKRILWLSNGSGRHCVLRLRVTEPIQTTMTDLIVSVEKEK